MNNILSTIDNLRKDFKKIENNQGKALAKIYDQLQQSADLQNTFETMWLGGWGQEDYNHYRNINNFQQALEVNDEYFYKILQKKLHIDIEKIEGEIVAHLKVYKKYQQTLITELSIIRNKEEFTNENEILKSIEEFQWGLTSSDYIKLRRPNQIPVYDLSILNRGLPTPPHISVNGFIISMVTQSFAVRNFEELISRILRQVELKFNSKSLPDNYSLNEKILNNLFTNFHAFSTQLRNRHNGRDTIEIKDEYDVQDLLHALLKLHFRDVREEEYTPSYGGSSTRMDFLLKDENIVIEVKKTRERLTDKEIGEQLILDVAHYRNHPNCNYLKCFVYDPENRIKNPRGLENDLNKLTNEILSIELFIRP